MRPGWVTGRGTAGGAVAVAVVLVVALSGCAWVSGDQVDLGLPGASARWLSLSGLSSREALVVTNESVEPDTGGQELLPLVVVLHGLGSEAEGMARISGWAAAARDRNLVVAFAQGSDNSFNAGGCCGEAATGGVDDVAYLEQVIDDVTDTFPADPDRTYLVGYSNGGMMTYRFLCEAAGRLAGAASVAGTNTSGCAPSAPVDFLQVSGAEDTVVPLAGGASSTEGIGPFPPVTESVAAVAAADGCPEPVVLADPPVTATRWTPCGGGVTVGLDVLAGADHGYPLAESYPATDRILAFWGVP